MSALQSGVSGLLSHQVRMDAIGNNIANVNTVGYKSERVLFGDAMHRLLREGSSPTAVLGGSNPMEVGTGVLVTGTDVNFAQGDLMATGRGTDIALQGPGMLVVTDGQQLYYTRDGALGLDATGNLIQLGTGMRIVALPGTDGQVPAGAVTPGASFRVPLGQSLARATTSAALAGNLDSRAAAGDTQVVTLSVFDSLGASHPLELRLTRAAAAGTWTVTGSSPDGTVVLPGAAQLTFGEDGRPTVSSLDVQLTLTDPAGATAALNIAVDTSALSQRAAEGQAGMSAQDGMPPGTLTGVAFEGNGRIVGTYSNGLRSDLGQLVTALFANPAGLNADGNNLYREGVNSGTALYGLPGADGRGTVVAGQLEGSNVDLAQQFADMIITQRGYQASSRVITTADQMLQELMNTAR